MQALFEMDGVYEEVCPMEDSLCSQRGSRMVLLFSVDNTVSILSGSLDIVSQVVFYQLCRKLVHNTSCQTARFVSIYILYVNSMMSYSFVICNEYRAGYSFITSDKSS